MNEKLTALRNRLSDQSVPRVDRILEAIDVIDGLLAQSQQPVAPIGVELDKLERFDVIGKLDSTAVLTTVHPNGRMVLFSDLEKLLALPQTEKGEGVPSVDEIERIMLDLTYGDGPVPAMITYAEAVNAYFQQFVSQGGWISVDRIPPGVGENYLACRRGNNERMVFVHWTPGDEKEFGYYKSIPSPPQDAGKVKP